VANSAKLETIIEPTIIFETEAGSLERMSHRKNDNSLGVGCDNCNKFENIAASLDFGFLSKVDKGNKDEKGCASALFR